MTVEFVSKEQSLLCRVIDRILKLISFGKMNSFMTDYVTTIGNTIYVPANWSSWPKQTQEEIVSHEMVHVEQQKRHGAFLFACMYLFLPFPIFFAKWRLEFEMEAYAQTCLHKFQNSGPVRRATIDWIVEQMTGPSYLWTWLSPKEVEALLRKKVQAITSQNIFEDEQ